MVSGGCDGIACNRITAEAERVRIENGPPKSPASPPSVSSPADHVPHREKSSFGVRAGNNCVDQAMECYYNRALHFLPAAK